jgi:diguanylate cyclase (GGDEF)-like protein
VLVLVGEAKRLRAVVPAGLEEWVANRQASAYFRSAKASAWPQVFSSALLFFAFYIAAPTKGFAVALTASCITMFLARGRIQSRSRKLGEERSPLNLITQIEHNAMLLALPFSIGTAYYLPLAASKVQLLIAIGATAMIGTAGLSFRYVIKAASWFLGILSMGLIIGLVQLGGWEVSLAIIAVGTAAIRINRMASIASDSFVMRILRERELHATSETVSLLLNDYQDQGSDWLFELDRNGNMFSVSPRFAQAAGKDPTAMNSRRFADLFLGGAEQDELAAHLAKGTPFRDLALPLANTPKSEKHWWSISGKPSTANPSAIVRFRGFISDISAEKQAQARVRHMIHFDSLTELPNRVMLAQAVNGTFALRLENNRIALLLIDFDHFKAINDMYGHPVGDAFLKDAAQRLSATLERSGLGGEAGLIARLGGDEFAIFVAGQDAGDQSVRLADLLVSAMATEFDVAGHVIESGVSIGIALAPDHADGYDTLLANADIALYAAKANGRGTWEMFAPGMDVALHERHALARDLRTAASKGELRLFLQPLVDVESSKNTGFEALLRWEHPERGLVMPNDFIPIAEETGLIVPVGEWVIRTAMAEAASWEEPYNIAINLSPAQLRSANLLPTVVNALAETGIDPARVEFEITETVLLHDSEANIAILNRLHALGFKIALDDFGTGYASLNYLLTFPFDKIKIDRSFVNDLENRTEAQAIVGAVISLANQLGMCTLAEGVEHEAQLTSLRAHGCEMVQGWLFGKAMPADHYHSMRRVVAETLPALVQLPRKAA